MTALPTPETCIECGGKIRHGACRDCGWDATADQTLTITRRMLRGALRDLSITRLGDGRADQTFNRLAELADPNPPAGPLAPWCHTCGNAISPEGQCACWCHIAEAYQRFAGIDFDTSALMASEFWASHADKPYVWAATYADDHDVPVYPDMRRYAPAEVREQDARDYPHDDPCPICGRRQWTDEHAQETCQACGFVFTGEGAQDDPGDPHAVALRARWAEQFSGAR
jgi:hypothetical protein